MWLVGHGRSACHNRLAVRRVGRLSVPRNRLPSCPIRRYPRKQSAAGSRCRRPGRLISTMPLLYRDSAPSTACLNPVDRSSCAARWFTRFLNSFTPCHPPTGFSTPPSHSWIRRGRQRRPQPGPGRPVDLRPAGQVLSGLSPPQRVLPPRRPNAIRSAELRATNRSRTSRRRGAARLRRPDRCGGDR